MVRLLPFVLLAGLLAGTAMLVVRADDRAGRDAARDAAVQAARQEAVNLTTISYLTAAHDVDRILALSTGDLHQRFAAMRDKFPSVLSRTKSTSKGTVLSAGLVRMSADLDTARVVVAVDATISNIKVERPYVTNYRYVLDLVRVDGRWLAGALNLAGLPR